MAGTKGCPVEGRGGAVSKRGLSCRHTPDEEPHKDLFSMKTAARGLSGAALLLTYRRV